MELADVDISPYLGLIHATAARYEPILDDDLDDIKQVLALKVAQAIVAFNPRRTRLPLRNFVFSCVTNRVKDLLKEQSRRNDRRGGGQLYVEDIGATATVFEAAYLCVSQEIVYAEVEDDEVRLPSTLTALERKVIELLLLDYNQTEIAAELRVTRAAVRKAHASVQYKMADWRPTRRALVVAA
jgi:RNA polymerase sigma factor (sigma-70 family)